MAAMDLSVHSVNKDNNNDMTVVDLSIGNKNVTDQSNDDVKDDSGVASAADKLRSLLPHLDIATLNILCLARLQVRIKIYQTYLNLYLDSLTLTFVHMISSKLNRSKNALNKSCNKDKLSEIFLIMMIVMMVSLFVC